MTWFQIFQDGPEYEARRNRRTFILPELSLKQLREAVPRHLFQRSTSRSLYFVLRHLTITFSFYYFGTHINWLSALVVHYFPVMYLTVIYLVAPSLWLLYWGWQGFAFAGLWCLGHEAGHNALSPYPAVNAAIGMAVHTFVLTPYHSWAITHSTHHKSTNNLERDEVYIPPTRKDFKLPGGKVAVKMDYLEVLDDTPAYTLFKMFVRQFFGFQLYLLHNRKGNPKYPPWTNHYNPASMLFREKHKTAIMVSDAGILSMLGLLLTYGLRKGWSTFSAHYLLPWLFAHNWIVFFTYLQHTDPTIPYYRTDQWTFARGALATVDRPLFGWVGRLILHNTATLTSLLAIFFRADNLPQVTEAIKPVLGEYYNYDSTPAIQALWRSFTQCIFVEDEGSVLFFKNKYGEALMESKASFESTACI